jgi:predicted ATPase/DNA-binding winged helix-turn-helix (wHTH) protein
MSTAGAAASLRFGRFELQPDERRLLVDGQPAPLGGRAFDVLVALAEQPGRLVGKHALMDRVWPGLVVQENNLAAQVSALRKVLGGDVVATIPGRGYRFIAAIAGRVGAPAVPASAHPVASAEPAVRAADVPALRTNLPAALPPLLGRDADLEALGRLVDANRLVTVVGAGGIGKTLLAQHLLAARRDAYPQGVCWVELTEVSDAEALPGAVAAALGVDTRQGEPLAALAGAVAPLELLLALDNAEHLLVGVAELCRALHHAAPGVRLLVTSQASLRLPSERVFRIESLAVPERSVSPAEALRFGAVALFVERAKAVDHRFALAGADTAAVIEVCRALDGMPLAIELAAARAPLLGVRPLLVALQERLKLLVATRNRSAPARQQALRSALEWSHALLGPHEQQVFRQLGVMAGSASLEFIEQVLVRVGAGGLDAWTMLDALDVLVDRSLVAVVPAADDGEPRYRLLETPRAYALERLEAAGERDALQRRHAYAVAARLDAAYDAYLAGRVGVDDWLRDRELDLDHARDAWRWARAQGDAELQLRIGTTMLRALVPTLHGERMALADGCEACIGPDIPESLRLKAWIELSCVLADSQKLRGRHAADEAVALARQLDAHEPDRFALYHALCRAASAAAQTADVATARVLLDEATALEDASWPAHRRIWAAEAGQWLARMCGDTAGALERGRRLTAIDRARGSHASIAIGNLIDAELAAGNAEAAARLGTELVDSLDGTRHEYSLAFARINLLAALLAQDDVAAAHPVAEAAWSRAGAYDLQHAAAAYLALLCALEGRDRAAVMLGAYSEAIYAARGETREQNETAATTRAQALAREVLGEAAYERARAEGAALRDAEVAAVAFADDETA